MGLGWEGASGYDCEGERVYPGLKHPNSQVKGPDCLPALLLIRCMTLGNIFNFSAP